MAIKIKNNTVIYDDEVLRVAANTTENRPVSPIIGMLRFNTTNINFEGYDGFDWNPVGTSGETDDLARTLAFLTL
jgi:hypothetical protein